MNYMKLKYIALQIIIITFAVLLSNSCTNAPEFYHSDEKGENMENKEEMDLKHAENGETGDKTVKEIFDGMTEEQKQVVYYIAGVIAEQKESEAQHSDEENEKENNNYDCHDINARFGSICHVGMSDASS